MSATHETSDNYHGEIIRRGSYRAVICRDGIQFIIQQRKRARMDGCWEAVGYCTTKKALIRLIRDVEPQMVSNLDTLPNHAHQYSPLPTEIDRRAA